MYLPKTMLPGLNEYSDVFQLFFRRVCVITMNENFNIVLYIKKAGLLHTYSKGIYWRINKRSWNTY